MANHNEKDQQEWDMEFKDPFSLEEDELDVYCSGSIRHPLVMTTTSFSESHLAVKTSNGALVQRVNTDFSSSLQTASHDNKPATTADLKLSNSKENFKHHQVEMEPTACLRTTVSVDESKRTEHMNEPVTPCSEKLSCDTNSESSCNEVEEQSPIPVMLSSAKRFCASDDIEKSRSTKQGGAYFRSPSALLRNSPCFARPTYSLSSYNIPAWPAGSLPVSNGRTEVQVQSVVRYNNCPITAVLSHPNSIPVLYSQSPVPIIHVTGSAHWPESRLHLQNILSKPPPPVPCVNHTTHLGVPARNFAVDALRVPNLQNGLTSHRLPLATVSQVIPPFLPPNINISASSHSVLFPTQQCHPHSTISGLADSALPVFSSVSLSASQSVPQCDAVAVQQPLPLSTSVHASTSLSCTVPVCTTECNNNKCLMMNDKTLLPSDQLRCTQPVMGVLSTVACTGLSMSNVCPPLTSSEFASRQTVTLPSSCSNTTPPQMKCTSPFALLDPRIRNGRQQNVGSAIPSSTNAASSQSSAFIVPVPPPLPSLEELTADRSEGSQKDDKAAIAGFTSQSTTSTMTDSAKLDRVITVATLT